MGYHRAGFDVVGVDIAPQPHYPFTLIQANWSDIARDAWSFRAEFDAIHASPPCQDYLNLACVNDVLGRERRHQRLIAAVRERLIAIGLPYVIENGPDARPELRDPIRLCGSSFGLAVRRHRLFECSFPALAQPCAHHLQRERRFWTSWMPGGERRLAKVVQVYGNGGDHHLWPEAMGIDWMTSIELREAIPPAYTEHIGHYLMAELRARAAA